jgi:hypothetical protein
MSSIAELKERVLTAEAERDYYMSLVDSFFSGAVPDGANFNHFIMAQWGRKRLEQKNRVPALCGGNTSD